VSISIDGCGVVDDAPLPEGTRLRVAINSEPAHDVSLFVEDGRLHAIGQYGRVIAERVAPNHVELFTIVPGEIE
jgi:hypothetical protein